MKATSRCPKCQSPKVGFIPVTYDRVAYPDEHYVPQRVGAIPSADVVGVVAITGRRGVGHYETYLCAECGYAERYVADPGSLPFERLEGFRWLNEPGPSAGPYR